MSTEQLYTASRLRVWRECQRKEFYKYTLGIRTQSTPAMVFGTRAHGALEAWYRAWQLGLCGRVEGKPDLRFVDASEYIDAADDISEIDRIRLRAIVAAYDARWGDMNWEILGVELEFRYWLGDVQIGGKIDALIRDLDTGKVWIVEHKTSTADTSPGSPYWAKLTLDTQISIYIDGAAYGLDYEIAGCIYDVLKRPLHELKLATPVESRKYTVGKGCKGCGGSAKAGEIAQGRGKYIVSFTTVEEIECPDCKGTGWKCDKDGEPEAPRLHSNQRDTDETLEQFEERISTEVADGVDDYLSRGEIVRLDSELPRMRQEILDTIAAMRALVDLGIAPPNHDACARGRDMCPFFPACAGMQDINDQHVFPRGQVHPELASAA